MADVNIHASNHQIWYRHPNSEAGKKHKFVTGATLLQLDWKVRASFKNGQSKKSHYVLISKHTLIPLFTEHFLFQ
jgi:hypothetical protein